MKLSALTKDVPFWAGVGPVVWRLKRFFLTAVAAVALVSSSFYS